MAKLKIKDLTIQLSSELVLKKIDLELNAPEIIGVVTAGQVEDEQFSQYFIRMFPETNQTASRFPASKRIFFSADANRLRINLTPLELLHCLEKNSQNYWRLKKFITAATFLPQVSATNHLPSSSPMSSVLSLSGYLVSETAIISLNQNINGSAHSNVKEIIATFSRAKNRSKIIFLPASSAPQPFILDHVFHLKKPRVLEPVVPATELNLTSD